MCEQTQTDEARSMGDATMIENMLQRTTSVSSSFSERCSEMMDDCAMLLIAEIDCLPSFHQGDHRVGAVNRIWSIVKRAKGAICPGVELSRELVLADEWIKSGSDAGAGLLELEASINLLRPPGRIVADKGRSFASIANGESSEESRSIDFTLPLPNDIPTSDGFVIDNVKAMEKEQAGRRPRRNPRAKGAKPAAGLHMKMRAKRATGGVATILDLSRSLSKSRQ